MLADAATDEAAQATADAGTRDGSSLLDRTDGGTPGPVGDGGLPSSCSDDTQCDDGLFCNGLERCAATSCEAGTAPALSDGDECTLDECDEENDVVVHSPTEACADASFGDDLPDPQWLTLEVIAPQAVFIGPDASYPIATGFRQSNNLHAVGGRAIYMWDQSVKLQPDDNFLFQIGQALLLEGDAFASFKMPMELVGELVLSDDFDEEYVPIYNLDVSPGRSTLTLLSDWTERVDNEYHRYLILATYDAGSGAMVRRHRRIAATRLQNDGQPQLSVDRYGRTHIFDKEAARIISPAGSVLLDVEGWYFSNHLGFAVDDNGVIYMNADDGGANKRIELIDRNDGEKSTLISIDDFRAAASSYVGASVAPPFGRYKALASGIVGATSADEHTLIYAISPDAEVRFIGDIGGGGFVSGFDYHAETGAIYMIRDDENRDPELLYNGR